jgi:hypothetical protein
MLALPMQPCMVTVSYDAHMRTWSLSTGLWESRCDTVASFTTTSFSSGARRHDTCEPFHLTPAYL